MTTNDDNPKFTFSGRISNVFRSSFFRFKFPDWELAFRLAYRESGCSPRGFVVFILCVFIGAFALASLTSILSSIERGVDLSARSLLDGDVVLSKTYTPISDDQLVFLNANSTSYSISATLRATMRIENGDTQLVAIKAVNDQYPQYALFEPRNLLPDLQQDSQTILVDSGLQRRFDLQTGASVNIGYSSFNIIGVVERESDLSLRNMRIAPRVLMSLEALDRTRLIQPGSLIRWSYRIVLDENTSSKEFADLWKEQFPDEEWRFRDQENAAPAITRAIERVDTFLLIVQLATIMIAGIGIANAFGAYIQSRRRAIAVWKCMGAEAFLIRRIYIIQCFTMALWGLVPALLLGNSVPWLIEDSLGSLLNISIDVVPSIDLLAYQVATLVLISTIFVLVPLFHAENIHALELFRGVGEGNLYRWQWAVVVLLACISSAFVIYFATNEALAAWFILSIAIAMGVFFALSFIIARVLAPLMPRLLRITLSRPGAATTSVCMSIGIGLSILIFLAVFQSSLLVNVLGSQAENQPSLFMMSITPSQIDKVSGIAASKSGISKFNSAPFLRSRILSLNGVERDNLPKEIRNHWVLSGSRIVTWRDEPPENNRLIAGRWWDKDYDGLPLVSFSHEEAQELGISIDDVLTINLLGRKITARVAAIHYVDWHGFAMNFVLIFSPPILKDAPQSYMATVTVDDQTTYDRFRLDIASTFPNITLIPVGEIIQEIRSLLALIARILTVVGGMCLFAGLLVMFGQAIARQRLVTYQTTLYRLCGASSRQIISLTASFYLMVGVIATIVALAVALLCSYGLIVLFLNAKWDFEWSAVLQTVAIAPLVAIITGLVSAALALRIKPFQILRND